MKRVVATVLLLSVLMGLLCMGVQATDDVKGIYGLELENVDGLTVTPVTAAGGGTAAEYKKIVNADGTGSVKSDFYEGAVKLTVTMTGADAQYYLIMAQSETSAPTADNLVYIDQASPSGGTVSFTVYPGNVADGQQYFIYYSCTGTGRTLLASYYYFEGSAARIRRPDETIAAPENVAAKVSGSSITVTWSAAPGAEKYRLDRRAFADGDWGEWASLSKKLTGTSYTDKSTVAGEKYEYRMKAYGEGEWSDFSDVASAVVAPRTPADVVATPTTGKVIITWTPSSGEDTCRLYRRDLLANGSWTGWATVSKRLRDGTFRDRTVEAGHTYEYKLRSYNGEYSGDSIVVSAKVTAAPPENVTAKVVSGGIKVTWDASYSAERYRVYRQEMVHGEWSASVSLDNKVKGTSYTDKTVVAGTKYRYLIKAYNGSWSKMSVATEAVKAK